MVQKTVSIPVIIVCVALLSQMMFSMHQPTDGNIILIISFMIKFMAVNIGWIACNLALVKEVFRKEK